MKHTLFLILSLLFVSNAAMSNSLFAAETKNTLAEINVVYPAEIYREKPTTKEVAENIFVLAKLMQIEGYDEGRVYSLLEKSDSDGEWMELVEQKGVLVKSIPALDELRIIDTTLASNPNGQDIGKEKAMEIARDTMKQLAEMDGLNRLNYGLDNVQVGYQMVGEGSMDAKVKTQHITEYRLTFRPDINGIELANAGVRIGVHRSGKITGIRLGGVSVKGTAKGVPVKVNDGTVMEAFNSLIPKGTKARIAWARPMYVLPDDVDASVVEPAMVYAYSVVSSSDGHEVVSRRKMVGLSLTSEKPVITDYSPPAKQHTGTSVSRDKELDFKANQDVLNRY